MIKKKRKFHLTMLLFLDIHLMNQTKKDNNYYSILKEEWDVLSDKIKNILTY